MANTSSRRVQSIATPQEICYWSYLQELDEENLITEQSII